MATRRTEIQKKYDTENTVRVTTKFNKGTDNDIIEYLDGVNKNGTIRAALREKMENDKKKENSERYLIKTRKYVWDGYIDEKKYVYATDEIDAIDKWKNDICRYNLCGGKTVKFDFCEEVGIVAEFADKNGDYAGEIRVRDIKLRKDYKSFGKTYIGYSDRAELTARGGYKHDRRKTAESPIYFGGDGSYQGYVVDSDTEIGDHYNLVAQFADWVELVSDDGDKIRYEAEEINIYRAMERGCIIQLGRSGTYIVHVAGTLKNTNFLGEKVERFHLVDNTDDLSTIPDASVYEAGYWERNYPELYAAYLEDDKNSEIRLEKVK